MWNFYGFLALYVFTEWQRARSVSSMRGRKWYRYGSRFVPGSPPGALFGIAWFLLYKLMIAALFVYTELNGPGASYFLYVTIVYIVNVELNKWWSVLFFDYGSWGWAVLVADLLWATAVAIAVFLGLEQAWLAFGLWMPYVLWLTYASYLSYGWWAWVPRK